MEIVTLFIQVFTKMYHDHRKVFWWDGLNGNIAKFVEKCLNCKQVKVKHQKTGGLLQEIQVHTYKCIDINVEFRGIFASYTNAT